MPSPPRSPYPRVEEEERQPHKALTDERHGDPADNRPSSEPAGTALKGGEGGPPKTCGCQCESKKPRRDALDWLTFGVLVLTFIAVGIYAWFARVQAVANKDAANAATKAARVAARSAKTASRQLELSERPWVSAKVTMVGPFMFTPDRGGVLHLAVSLKNTGHSVALNVFERSKVFAGLPDEIPRWQAEWCEPLRHRTENEGIAGSVLFPGEESAETGEGTGIDPEEIASGLKRTTIAGKINMMLVTCIDYRFAFAPEHHQTRYAFFLGRPEPSGGWMAFFAPEGTPEGLTLIESFNGNSAD